MIQEILLLSAALLYGHPVVLFGLVVLPLEHGALMPGHAVHVHVGKGLTVVLRLAVVHGHLVFDVHHRQAGIVRLIVSEGAACKPVLGIDPVRDILVVRLQDDFSVAVCKHITAASLRNP